MTPLEPLQSSATCFAVLLLLAMRLSCCEVATLLQLSLVYCCCIDAWRMGVPRAYEHTALPLLIRMNAC
jgi:hypothetical protein